MNRQVFLAALLAAIIALLPAGYLYLIWPKVLAFVPTHYGADWAPNHFVRKEWLWNIGWVPAIAFVVLTFFPQVRPGQSLFWSSARQRWTRLVIVAAVALDTAVIVRSGAKASRNYPRLLPPREATEALGH